MLMPRSWMPVRLPGRVVVWRSRAVSVISTHSRPGSRPLTARASSIASRSPVSASWRAETLTRMVSGRSGRAAAQAAAWAQAWRSAQSPMSRIRPVSSATSTNRSAVHTEPSGWCQRSSASTAIIVPVARSTSGWYQTASWPRLQGVPQVGLDRQPGRDDVAQVLVEHRHPVPADRPWPHTSPCRPPGAGQPASLVLGGDRHPDARRREQLRPGGVKGRRNASTRRQAARTASVGSSRSRITITNSSPPRRATRSPARTTSRCGRRQRRAGRRRRRAPGRR